MKTARIYHNPRCSKSRTTLSILEENGIDVEIVKYLESPLKPEEIRGLLKKLGMNAADIMRVNEPEYKEHIKGKELDEQQLLDTLFQYPKIIERPIVVIDEKAVIGRPPENVLDII